MDPPPPVVMNIFVALSDLGEVHMIKYRTENSSADSNFISTKFLKVSECGDGDIVGCGNFNMIEIACLQLCHCHSVFS